MSCQFTWNYNDYKFNIRKKENNIVTRTTVCIFISKIENNSLEELRGYLVSDDRRLLPKKWKFYNLMIILQLVEIILLVVYM